MKKNTLRHRTIWSTQSGQVMLFVVLGLGLFLIGATAFAIDLSNMWFNRQAAQTAADAAKMGIRYAIVHGTGNTNCSGPGTTGVVCPDVSGANVVAAVLSGNSTCATTCGWASL